MLVAARDKAVTELRRANPFNVQLWLDHSQVLAGPWLTFMHVLVNALACCVLPVAFGTGITAHLAADRVLFF